jgi:hypothetical protein
LTYLRSNDDTYGESKRTISRYICNMSQEFNQFIYDSIIKSYYQAITEKSLKEKSEEIKAQAKHLINILHEESVDAGISGHMSEDKILENDKKQLILEKIYLSFDEINPFLLKIELREYAKNYCAELERLRKINPPRVVKAQVIETFKAPRIKEGSKLSEFLKKL